MIDLCSKRSGVMGLRTWLGFVLVGLSVMNLCVELAPVCTLGTSWKKTLLGQRLNHDMIL